MTLPRYFRTYYRTNRETWPAMSRPAFYGYVHGSSRLSPRVETSMPCSLASELLPSIRTRSDFGSCAIPGDRKKDAL